MSRFVLASVAACCFLASLALVQVPHLSTDDAELAAIRGAGLSNSYYEGFTCNPQYNWCLHASNAAGAGYGGFV